MRVLDAAQRVGLLGARQSFVVLSLELHTQPLHTFSHGGANITGTPKTTRFEANWPNGNLFFAAFRRRAHVVQPRSGRREQLDSRVAQGGEGGGPCRLGGRAAAHRLSARVRRCEDRGSRPPRPAPGAHRDARRARRLRRRPRRLPRGLAAQLPPRGKCPPGGPTRDRRTSYKACAVQQEEWNGISGALSWEANGQRRVDQLQVVELQRGGQLTYSGVWTPSDGVTWDRPIPANVPAPTPGLMVNRTFTVLIAMVTTLLPYEIPV